MNEKDDNGKIKVLCPVCLDHGYEVDCSKPDGRFLLNDGKLIEVDGKKYVEVSCPRCFCENWVLIEDSEKWLEIRRQFCYETYEKYRWQRERF